MMIRTRLTEVRKLDDIRLQRGIASQPMFDIAGTIYGGAPPYESFAEVLDFALQQPRASNHAPALNSHSFCVYSPDYERISA